MLSTDKDALICDMAETYHIYNIEALPVETLATLSYGLRDNSRIKMKIAGVEYVPLEIIMPQIADNMAIIRYSLTAKKGDAPPKLMSSYIYGDTKKSKETKSYSTGAEFEAERRRLLKGINNG